MAENNRNIKALNSGIWYTLSSFLVKGIGFLITPIFTRLLTQSEFGQYNNFLSWLAILTILASLNLESTLISAKYDFNTKFDEYIFSIRCLGIISVFIWLVITNIFSNQFVHLFGMDQKYINYMLIYLLFYPAINLFQSRERYYFEYKKTVAISILVAGSTAILSVLCVLNFSDKLNGRILGFILPTIIIGAIIDLFIFTKGKVLKTSYWSYALPICLPYILHLLSLTLLNSTDRIMINKWCGATDTALYSLAYTCGTMVTMIAGSINNAYAPWLGEKLNKNEYKNIKKFSYIYIAAFFFSVIGVMLIAPEILYILGGREYLDAKYVITPVAMGCVFQFLYMMFVNVEQFKKKTVGMSIASLIAAIINFGLNCYFIPRFGYLAAAYTTLVGFLILLLIHMYLVKRIKLSVVYDYRFVFLIIIVGISFTIGITILYSFSIIRYITFSVYCLIYIIILYKNKSRILKFIKNG